MAQGSEKIEDTISFYSLSFVNVLFGKYLILNGEYHHFLGISGQLLGLNNLFHMFFRRYTHIYILRLLIRKQVKQAKHISFY